MQQAAGLYDEDRTPMMFCSLEQIQPRSHGKVELCLVSMISQIMDTSRGLDQERDSYWSNKKELVDAKKRVTPIKFH
ncbi:hypothetical protein ACS0TY_004916 [Phlomoides rotata]